MVVKKGADCFHIKAILRIPEAQHVVGQESNRRGLVPPDRAVPYRANLR